MSTKNKETIGFVLRKSGLSDNAGLYVEGNKDIDSKELITISRNIKKYVGLEEQTVFNQMVLDLPIFEIKTFIEFTVRLEIDGSKNIWRWNRQTLLNHYDKDTLNNVSEKVQKTKEIFFKKMGIK